MGWITLSICLMISVLAFVLAAPVFNHPGDCSFTNKDTCGYTLGADWSVHSGEFIFHRPVISNGSDDEYYALFESMYIITDMSNLDLVSPVIPAGTYILNFHYIIPAATTYLAVKVRTDQQLCTLFDTGYSRTKEWTNTSIVFEEARYFQILFSSTLTNNAFIGIDDIRLLLNARTDDPLKVSPRDCTKLVARTLSATQDIDTTTNIYTIDTADTDKHDSLYSPSEFMMTTNTDSKIMDTTTDAMQTDTYFTDDNIFAAIKVTDTSAVNPVADIDLVTRFSDTTVKDNKEIPIEYITSASANTVTGYEVTITNADNFTTNSILQVTNIGNEGSAEDLTTMTSDNLEQCAITDNDGVTDPSIEDTTQTNTGSSRTLETGTRDVITETTTDVEEFTTTTLDIITSFSETSHSDTDVDRTEAITLTPDIEITTADIPSSNGNTALSFLGNSFAGDSNSATVPTTDWFIYTELGSSTVAPGEKPTDLDRYGMTTVTESILFVSTATADRSSSLPSHYSTPLPFILEDIVSISCSSTKWNISIDLVRLDMLYPGINISDIYWGTNNCTGQEYNDDILFQYSLMECQTTQQQADDTIRYTNKLYHTSIETSNPFLIRDHKWTYNVECDVINDEATSSHVHHAVESHNSVVVGHHSIGIAFYRDGNFREEIPENPLVVNVGERVFVKVYTNDPDWTVKMKLHTCYTTPSSTVDRNIDDDSKYYLIKDGCEVDSTTHIISQSTHESTFMFQDFEYFGYDEGLDITCNVTFCDTSDFSSRCLQSCTVNQVLIG